MLKYGELMRESKDKKYFRLKVVQNARTHGIKATARLFGCTRHTVRKWLRRYRHGRYEELGDISRRPERSPRKLPAREIRRLVEIKQKARTIGAERLKDLYGLTRSPRTMRSYWRQAGIGYSIRKKHQTQRDLREIKARRGVFAQIQVDTKDLKDIPEYWEAMMDYGLPPIQYTAREVVSGLQMIGYAQERSLTHSLTFMDLIRRQLEEAGVDPKQTEIQSDNGSEFIGSWNAKEDSVFTQYVKTYFKEHVTIPPGASNWQADVETVHGRIEAELYCLESFRSWKDLQSKATTYIAWYNLLRKNSYKKNLSPWQIFQRDRPEILKSICFFPIVLLDSVFSSDPFLRSFPGGHHVHAELGVGMGRRRIARSAKPL